MKVEKKINKIKKIKKTEDILMKEWKRLDFDIKINDDALNFIEQVERDNGNINVWQSYTLIHHYLSHFYPIKSDLDPVAELYFYYHALKKLKRQNELYNITKIFNEKKNKVRTTIKRKEEGDKRRKWNKENPSCKVSKWNNDGYNKARLRIIKLKETMIEIGKYYPLKNLDKYLDFQIPNQIDEDDFQSEYDIKMLKKKLQISYNTVIRYVNRKYQFKIDKLNEILNKK